MSPFLLMRFWSFNCLVLLLDGKGVFEVGLALLHFIYPASNFLVRALQVSFDNLTMLQRVCHLCIIHSSHSILLATSGLQKTFQESNKSFMLPVEVGNICEIFCEIIVVVLLLFMYILVAPTKHKLINLLFFLSVGVPSQEDYPPPLFSLI